MKIKSKNIIRNLCFVLTCCFLLTIKGCDSQSGEVIYTDDFSVALYKPDPPGYPDWVADRWRTGEYPEHDDDIYSVAGGYLLQLKSNGTNFRQENIRVDVRVSDYGFIPHNTGVTESLWDDLGYITFWPQTGMRIDDDGTAHGRTDENGRLIILVGLGGPDIFSKGWTPNLDYLWPDWISTWAEFEITISKHNQLLKTVYVWALFDRVQYQHFWDQPGLSGTTVYGVISTCEFGTGHWMQKSSMRIDESQTPINTIEEPVSLNLSEVFPVKTPKGKQTDYPIPSTLSEKKIVHTMNGPSSSGITINWAE